VSQLGARRQKFQHGLFVNPIADGAVVVAPGNVDNPHIRDERRERMRVAGHIVARADANQVGAVIFERAAGSSPLPQPRAQAASARRSLRVDSAKPRNILRPGSSMSSIRSISIASAIPGAIASRSIRLTPTLQQQGSRALGLARAK